MNSFSASRCGRSAFWSLATAAAFLIVGSAHAGVLIGINPVPPPGPYVGDDNNDDMIMVGSPTDPVPIQVDPSGSAWTKQFVINRDGQGWFPGQSVTVMEWLTFPPSTLQPIDWHETIDPTSGDGGNFQWAGGSILIGPNSYPSTQSPDGKSISFDFPPIQPSDPVKITKNLVWTGDTITPGLEGQNNYVITITEQPTIRQTPEPTAFVVWGLVVAGIAVAARRCSSYGGSCTVSR